MTSNKNLLIGFLSIILLTTILGLTSIYKLLGLSEITQKMYNHPFTVSKAILQIKIQTGKIQYDMLHLSSLKDISEIHKITLGIDKHHHIADESYKLIFDKYLGDIKDIKKSYEMFLKWKLLREDFIVSLINNKNENIQIIRDTEISHQNELTKLLTTLENFANNKAVNYNQMAQDSKITSVIIVLILFILIVTISIIIATITIRNFVNSTHDIKRYFHLIEHNVNIAQLNPDTSIKEVSHSLARLLNSTKEELKDNINFLFGKDEQQISQIKNTIESSEQYQGEVWIQDKLKNNLWIYVDIQVTLDSDFKIIGYTMIINDITSKKLLEVVSKTDAMTGLFNRREFENNFEKRLKLAKREEKILVFMMIDIDHFKLYNDNYGHQAGDFALKNVSKSLKAIFSRPDDMVFRLGGEEFGILFTTLNKDGVFTMADRILARIKNLNITHDFSSVGNFVSVSIGVGIISATPQSDLYKETIYNQVDAALYEAKDNGRNRYEVISIS